LRRKGDKKRRRSFAKTKVILLKNEDLPFEKRRASFPPGRGIDKKEVDGFQGPSTSLIDAGELSVRV